MVYFETGFGTEDILDYWSVLIHVQDGSAPGFYVSSGTDLDPYWKECQLQHEDAGQTNTLSVNTTVFSVALESGGCSGGGPWPSRRFLRLAGGGCGKN